MAAIAAYKKGATMNSETYKEMKERHQREVNELPIKYAFSTEQFNAMLAAWNIQPGEEKDKLQTLSGTGGYYRTSDTKLINDTIKRIVEEHKAAVNADKDGSGYIYQMFLYELNAHEYAYTGDVEDTLQDLGLTREEIDADEALYNGLAKATAKVMQDDLFY